MSLSQPEPIPTTPKVPIGSLPFGLAGAFMWGGGPYETCMRVQGPAGSICFLSTGAIAVVAESNLVIPSPLKAFPA